MKKIIFLICAVWLFSASLTTTKKELKNTSYKIARMNKKLDALASEIIKKQNEIEKIEKKYLEYALKETNWNRQKAAQLLGITNRSIRYRINKLGIKENE